MEQTKKPGLLIATNKTPGSIVNANLCVRDKAQLAGHHHIHYPRVDLHTQVMLPPWNFFLFSDIFYFKMFILKTHPPGARPFPCRLTKRPMSALGVSFLVLVVASNAAAAFEVVGTDSQKAFITYTVAPSGISSSTTQCRLGCGGEQQIHGVGMIQNGVFYTLRNKLGLGIGKIIVHGFDLSSKKTVCEIKVPALAHFGDNFASGAYGLQVLFVVCLFVITTVVNNV